jgi:hypothetical protein
VASAWPGFNFSREGSRRAQIEPQQCAAPTLHPVLGALFGVKHSGERQENTMKSLRLSLFIGILIVTTPSWATSEFYPPQKYVEAECAEINGASDASINITIETLAFTDHIIATLTETSIAGERTLATLPVRMHPNDSAVSPTRYRGLEFDLKINTHFLPDESDRYFGRLNTKIGGTKIRAELTCQLYMRPM